MRHKFPKKLGHIGRKWNISVTVETLHKQLDTLEEADERIEIRGKIPRRLGRMLRKSESRMLRTYRKKDADASKDHLRGGERLRGVY